MKYIITLCAMTFVAATGWRLGGQLSSDAIGMALGILFGIMAAIPASLMMFAAKRRYPYGDYEDDYRPRRPQYREIPQPVIQVNNYSLTVSPIDPRLNFTGEVTQDGFHLAQCAVGTKISEVARSHDGYGVSRFGSYIGLKPLSEEAARQLRHQCHPVIDVTGGGNNAQQPSNNWGEDFGDPWSQRGHPQISGPVDARPERVFRVVGEAEEIHGSW